MMMISNIIERRRGGKGKYINPVTTREPSMN